MEKVTLATFTERHLQSGDIEIIKACKMYELKEGEYFIRFGKDKNVYKVYKNSRNVGIFINLIGEKVFLSNMAEQVRQVKINDIGQV